MRMLTSIIALVGVISATASETREFSLKLNEKLVKPDQGCTIVITSPSRIERGDLTIEVLGDDGKPIILDREDQVVFSKPFKRRDAKLFKYLVHIRTEMDNGALSSPGTHRLTVRSGTFEKSVTINTVPTDPEESEAIRTFWASAYPLIQDDLNEPVDAAMSDELMRRAKNMIVRHPNTSAARICELYLTIGKFKEHMRSENIRGGRTVYGPIATDLRRLEPAVRDNVLLRDVALFYGGYASALAGDYEASRDTIAPLVVLESTSIWHEMAIKLQAEIASK